MVEAHRLTRRQHIEVIERRQVGATIALSPTKKIIDCNDSD
jgi:hypothetical protein